MRNNDIFIYLFFIYLFSFTPYSNTFYINDKVINADRVMSNLHTPTMSNNLITDFFHASSNTILFNLPVHYGALIGTFDKSLGNRIKVFGFAHRFKPPIHKSSGWGIGLVTGWLVRVGFLIFLAVKWIKSEY